jgi:hypothetical protein
MKLNIRLNNVAIQAAEHSPDSFNCLWYFPNVYYGKMQSMLADGWEDCGNRIHKQQCNIYKSCFEHEKSCFVFAYIDFDAKEPDTVLHTVGSRLLEVPLRDRDDFFTIYKTAHEQILRHYLNEHKED